MRGPSLWEMAIFFTFWLVDGWYFSHYLFVMGPVATAYRIEAAMVSRGPRGQSNVDCFVPGLYGGTVSFVDGCQPADTELLMRSAEAQVAAEALMELSHPLSQLAQGGGDAVD
jgi:hypothetical protein